VCYKKRTAVQYAMPLSWRLVGLQAALHLIYASAVLAMTTLYSMHIFFQDGFLVAVVACFGILVLLCVCVCVVFLGTFLLYLSVP